MKLKRFNISIPDKLVAAIDRAADAKFMSRSEYIRQAVTEKLDQQPAPVKPPAEELIAPNVGPFTDSYRRPSARS